MEAGHLMPSPVPAPAAYLSASYYIEPDLFRLFENERGAMPGGRRSQRTVTPRLDGNFSRDTIFLSQQYAFTEAKKLYRQAQVDGNLHYKSVPIFPHVTHFRCEFV